MSNLFIPKKIKVGYQKRDETYTGKLAYIIYYDVKGKLRKETSWEQWRSDKIKPNEFDNKPTEGFVLNKAIKRYNWSHFGSNRSYHRMYDPRDIEFEITPENLIGLLMECDCNKRMLDGKFVYAWQGTELVLLPCGSESYKEAMENTKRQGQKVSARELKAGCSYTLKNGNEVIYMGRFPWYLWDPNTDKPHARTMKKFHIFYDGKNFDRFTSMDKLSFINSDQPVQEYAELMDKLKDDIRVQKVVGWETKKASPTKISINKEYYYPRVKNNKYFKLQGNVLKQYIIDPIYIYHNDSEPKFILREDCWLDTNTLKVTDSRYYTYDDRIGNKRGGKIEQEVLNELSDCVRVYAVLESGAKYKIEEISTWHMPGQY